VWYGYGQRQLDIAAELSDKAPPGFAELLSEILGFAKEEEEGLLRVPGMQSAGKGQDPASMLFVALTDERGYPWKGPFLREVSFLSFPFLRDNLYDWWVIDACATVGPLLRPVPGEFESWLLLQEHLPKGSTRSYPQGNILA
jgi:hypothetical protein